MYESCFDKRLHAKRRDRNRDVDMRINICKPI